MTRTAHCGFILVFSKLWCIDAGLISCSLLGQGQGHYQVK